MSALHTTTTLDALRALAREAAAAFHQLMCIKHGLEE